MTNIYNINDNVLGRSTLTNMVAGVIKDVLPPHSGQRGFKYQVKWSDGSQSEEFEHKLWRSHASLVDNVDSDSDDDSDEPSDDDSEEEEANNTPPNLPEAYAAVGVNGDENVAEQQPENIYNVAGRGDRAMRGGRGRQGRGGRGRGRGNANAVNNIEAPANVRDPNLPHVAPAEVDMLSANGQHWEVQNSIAENINIGSQSHVEYHLKVPAVYEQQRNIDGTLPVFIYFLLAFPWFYWTTIVDATNEQLEREPQYANQAPNKWKVTIGGLITWLGEILVMALNPIRGSTRDYWATKSSSSRSMLNLHAYNFGQYGISKNRFDLIKKNFRLNSYIPNVVNQDPWIPIRGFIDAFNQRQYEIVIPGGYITIDECMCWWGGKEAKWSADGMPHVTKIARKPKGIGAELKSAADGESGVIIRLEVQEGKEAMANKEFMDRHAAHTAITLRLVQPWFGSKRVILADSAFASFNTCVALLCVGLYFIGIVKTASKFFPKLFLMLGKQQFRLEDHICF